MKTKPMHPAKAVHRLEKETRRAERASAKQASSSTPPGNGAVSPFGNGRGGVDPSQSQSGAHDFTRDPTTKQNVGGGRDFTRESRPQGAPGGAQNSANYLECRPQPAGGAEKRTNASDAGAGGVNKMPGDIGAANRWEGQQAQRGSANQRLPYKGMK